MNAEGYYTCYDENGEPYYSSSSTCTVENEDQYLCPYCYTTFTTKSGRDQHILGCSKRSDYCIYCKAEFSTLEECAEHEEKCPQRPGNENNGG